MLYINNNVRSRWTGSKIGTMLVSNVSNNGIVNALNMEKENLVKMIREKYSGGGRNEILGNLIIKKYVDYYKGFGKTYHLLLQLESIVFKNKDIPSVSPIVLSMFMAEMKNMYLTAAHDFESIEGPLTVDLAQTGNSYTMMNGKTKNIPEGDIYTRDNIGIISSIIDGPDNRTKITATTKKVLYYVYVPFETENEKVIEHLNDIRQYLEMNSPSIQIENLKIGQ